ncbi:NAD(P)-dependent alcohol dehydrogenase [Nocardioides zhouii]|uniref:NAD(P)-dependent alcohol dehydrogenase n=2 Tax=Nocardioides zhouii TaxID=1168729 RepID=A0A4Q2SUG1_9ACTN|nr:NAD(P)-dependent alcohol dehydrogenase [Nocardioides zhouii]
MRAITQYRYGNADVLRTARVPMPAVGDDQVLVRVRAAGLDRGTEHLLTGKPYAVRLATGVRRPRNPVPGRDVAGIVAEVGADVVGFAPGDAVYGVAPGSFAEYAVTTSDKLSRKPDDITFAQAAVMPISAGTALQALTLGGLQAGQSVLITGASGGVGSYAVQIADALGAEVTGVCSPAKADYVRAMGAHHVLTYPHDSWTDGTHRWDLVIDIAGNPTIRELRRALTPHGTAVFVGGENAGAVLGMARQIRGALLSPFVGQRFIPLLARERAEHFERLTQLIEAGQLGPALDRTYPLEQAANAMRQLERGTIRGKVAITVFEPTPIAAG